jgi:hypothetical protein
MRKFLYILIGIAMVGGAVSAFGARQVDWNGQDAPSAHSIGHRALERSMDGEPRTWFSGPGPHDEAGSLFNAAKALDMLNVIVGVFGLALAISGVQMSLRGRS